MKDNKHLTEEQLFDEPAAAAANAPAPTEPIKPAAPAAPEPPAPAATNAPAPPELDTTIPEPPKAPEAPEGDEVTLSGVEQFLTGYGIKGGLISYEDGDTRRFSELESNEQAEILSSLVKAKVPSIEEKYNLEKSEIELLNMLRESGKDTENFVNDIVDYRVQTLLSKQGALKADLTEMPDDAMFIKHLRDRNSEFSDEQLASELEAAKGLSTYADTVDAIRGNYIAQQQIEIQKDKKETGKLFNEELEEQRADIVKKVEDVSSIGGTSVTDAMKEYLLHDIMELNDNNDPILMEKIFSNPETMFKVNWFLNYGEKFMGDFDKKLKSAVSLAAKDGYDRALNGMPQDAMVTGVVGKRKAQDNPTSMISPELGKTVTEEELYNDI